MATYSTPGVYVEEITKFPPSVAQVQTAIPAFIGYTQIAKKKVTGDLNMKPTRIKSMLEYENYFGYALPESDITVDVQGTSIEVTGPGAAKSPYLMYYSMQMYFANGGGPCYIVSIGQYESSTPPVLLGDMEDGLAEIRKYDEPTLLVFPDATSLSVDEDFYALYSSALTQCYDLQDRFTIIDTFSDEEYDDGTGGPVDPLDAMRNAISLQKDYLKYGAVYYPFLETILDYTIDEDAVMVTTTIIPDYEQQVQDLSDTIDTTDLTTLLTDFKQLATDVNSAGAPAALLMKADIIAKINEIIDYLNTVADTLTDAAEIGEGASTNPSSPTDPVMVQVNALDSWITTNIEALILSLNMRIDEVNSATTKSGLLDIMTDTANAAIDSVYEAVGMDTGTVSNSTIITDIDTLIASGPLDDLITELAPLSGGPSTVSLASLASTDDLLYNKIKQEISQIPITLPPSSAMAGIYARVDRTNGVWKAPANVGVNYVLRPSVIITNDEQGEMNIHTTGKSVNAIRSFTGKGILVWGARTLAGNDNEWRYVSVRRFFNMAEESIRKATEPFVFESNDANTWVRVRAMIENFLILQWRAGALTGAKPEQAFYVRVGLGQTMTAEDILNGYMNIEIGMAVVRPAEFIVLKFSHKMQEA